MANLKDYSATYSEGIEQQFLIMKNTTLRAVKRVLSKKELIGNASIVEHNSDGDKVFYYKPRPK